MAGSTMKSTTVLVILFLGGAAVAGLVFALTTHMQSADAQVTKEISSLRQQLDVVAKERSKTTFVVHNRPDDRPTSSSLATTDPAPSPEATAAPKDPLLGVDAEERQYRLGIMKDARAKLVAEAMASEPIDPAWSQPAAQLLQATCQGEGFAGATFVATCKSTICKVDIDSNDPRQGEAAMRRLTEKLPWPTNGTSSFSRKTGKGVIYLAREDTRLPNIDPATLTF